ncbi:MAG TPA: 16S rRNA (cytosine(1402)-N(4))-methyltransferase RsmH [Mariprofundaceae bacterium]|nr:16S rRNA (cytosine(1402)-N(4))-methyltransferase RsmH [Mariprofundaceae bacterium]
MEDHGQHIPVLLLPFVDAIVTDPDGRYVDATFGRGGHSREILRRLSPQGRLLGIDRDPSAIAAGEQLAAADTRFRIAHAAFADLEHALADNGWDKVNGIGFDLGISSPQVDDAARGFSFQQSGPLDMRMNTTEGLPLARMLDQISEQELARVIRDYGDERYAQRIANAILAARRKGELNTTADLENACFHAVPKQARFGGTHPATRTFQALRMWVNDEVGQIERGLQAAMQHLLPGGHLAVISFHSGEDRLVRDLIESEVHPCVCPPQFPVCVCGRTPTMRWLQKKPVRPDESEVTENPRSRSSRLRIAEALA